VTARRLLGGVVALAAVLTSAGCTLTAAEREENRQVALAVGELDPAAHQAVDINCSSVPWLGEALADRSVRCWMLDLPDGATAATAEAIATELAAASGGEFTGQACGDVDGATVQCAAFASMPEARNANVEVWVALDDEAVAQLPPGSSAGTYFVTFRLVAYGPEFYQSGSPTPSAPALG